MGIFRFKEFDVINEKASMKVNTDAVLVGACVTVSESDLNILDVGTGNGCIALILAQRYSTLQCSKQKNNLVQIEGIDIDNDSAEEAKANFQHSPWNDFLQVKKVSLLDFQPIKKYSLIVSNPPYYEAALQAPSHRRNSSRHEYVDISKSDNPKGLSTVKQQCQYSQSMCQEKKTCQSMSYRDVMDFAIKNLELNGRLALIMPADREKEIVEYGETVGLKAFRILRIKTVPHKPYRRVILELIRKVDVEKNTSKTLKTSIEDLFMKDEKGRHTSKYISLVKAFYLNM